MEPSTKSENQKKTIIFSRKQVYVACGFIIVFFIITIVISVAATSRNERETLEIKYEKQLSTLKYCCAKENEQVTNPSACSAYAPCCDGLELQMIAGKEVSFLLYNIPVSSRTLWMDLLQKKCLT